MTKTLVEANKRIREHFSAARNEDGMEAAQVILILILVVLVLVPAITFIGRQLGSRGSQMGSSVTGYTG